MSAEEEVLLSAEPGKKVKKDKYKKKDKKKAKAIENEAEAVGSAENGVAEPEKKKKEKKKAKAAAAENGESVESREDGAVEPKVKAKKTKKAKDSEENGESVESPEDGAVEPKKKDRKEKKKAKAARENGESAEPEEDGAAEPEKKSKKEKKAKDKAAKEAGANGDAPTALEGESTDKGEEAADGDAQPEEVTKSKKDKKKRKKEKKDKKRKADAAEDVEMTDAPATAPATAPEPKDKKRKTRDDDAAAPAPKKTKSTSHGTYTQSAALSALPQSEIDDFLASKFVTITDDLTKDAPPRPILSFSHLPPTPLLSKSPFAAFAAPTPIQAASWPFTLSGRDVIGIAETGSGKTMAFALPCVEALYNAGGDGKKEKGIRAVVVCPTRELAMQTHEQVTRLSSLVGLSCVCVYGGAPKPEQREALRGADILVATPGRLKDFLSEGSADLSRARFVVLDEADRMLDTGFEEDIKEILSSCPPREARQTLMFTATWPASVQALASSMMTSPAKITISTSAGADPEGGDLQANKRITQRVEVVEPRDKESRLLQLLRENQKGPKKDDRILVFALYKKEATRVEEFLRRKGVRVAGIHGDLKQEQRTRSLEAFKAGKVSVLVATDVAARGLDIPEVKVVINLTVSFSPEHRAPPPGLSWPCSKGRSIC